MAVDTSLPITGPLFLLTYVFVQVTSLIISIALAPFYVLAGGRYFVLKIRQKFFRGAPNRSTLPGTPAMAWPQYFPLAGTAKSAWFVGLLWILQWESMFEIMMVGTIFPVLLIPLGTIFGNVGEELLSWIEGCGDPEDAEAREGLQNLVADPQGSFRFLALRMPGRIWASLGGHMGLDFSISSKDVQDFFNPHLTRPAQLKATAWVLTKAALMSYERLHVFEGIVDRDWNSAGSGPKYTSKLLCAWQFDKITSADPALSDHQSTWGKTTAFLISIELAATAGAPNQKALILVFRGTEPFENLEWFTDSATMPLQEEPPDGMPQPYGQWFTDFATAPPQEEPPNSAPQPYGQVHQGFEMALGLESRVTTLQPAEDVQISYILYEESQGGYKAKRMPCPNEEEDTWPPTLMDGSPYGIISSKIVKVMKADSAYKLYVSGHSLGAALANMFAAALLIPPQSPWNEAGFKPDRFTALCTQGRPRLGTYVDNQSLEEGQPRLGTYMYNQSLEEVLCDTGDPTAYKFIRLVNADDIVCRVPPLQVTLPPFFPVTGMWEHPGHLLFLPVRHISFVQNAKHGALKLKQTLLQRLWPDKYWQMPVLQPQADVMPMFEQPVSYRNSLFWNAVRRALFCTWRYCFEGGAGNATLLRLVADWFIVVTVFPLGVALLLVPPLFPLALGLILFSVLFAGMLEGVSDHALDGYVNAIAASKPDQWGRSRARSRPASKADHKAPNGLALTQ